MMWRTVWHPITRPMRIVRVSAEASRPSARATSPPRLQVPAHVGARVRTYSVLPDVDNEIVDGEGSRTATDSASASRP
jgi:hypothetical protein